MVPRSSPVNIGRGGGRGDRAPTADPPGQRPADRLHSIDLMRGVAVILMIGAHATHAFLSDAYKHNEGWYNTNILFGFVAPAFLFLSGIALWVALHRRNESDRPLRKSSYRLLRVLLIGYWLQIPVLSIRQLIWNQRLDELQRLFDANILQVIAISGLLLLGLLWMLKHVEKLRIAALLLGIALFTITPYLWSSDLYLDLPLAVRFYFAPQPESSFPLIPYAGYYCIGFFLAQPITAAVDSYRRQGILLVIGAIGMATGLGLDEILQGYPPHNEFWRSSIQHLLFRLGGLIAVAALCLAAARAFSSGGTLGYIGRRSLGIYVLNLMLIYGSPVNKGMWGWYDSALRGSLSPLETVMTIAAILMLCVAAVKLWDWFRRAYPAAALWCKRIAWAIFWGFFLLTP